jgi:tetratricopeptide (TPR) repeat protein
VLANESIHPRDVREILDQLRIRPEEMDASMLLPFIPGATHIDQERDKRLLACAVILAEAATTHGAITWCLEHRPWDFAAVLYNALDQFCHLFSAYHPPKSDSISPREFELYGGVVTAAYRFHDMMLGRLMELAGDDATIMIVSDHGFRIARARRTDVPRNLQMLSLEHRTHGICLMRGPGIRRGATLEGASLLDVTPTVLALFGLPQGSDMDGRAWVEVMDQSVNVDKVISWEGIAGDSGMQRPESRESQAESLEAVRHLIELGYVDPPDEDVQKSISRVLAENQFNLARALIDARQPTRAIELLERLVQVHPTHAVYNAVLFEANFSVGRDRDCEQIAQAMWERGHRGPLARLALGAVRLMARDVCAAQRHFEEALRVHPEHSGLHVLIGRAFLRLQDWEAAARAVARALLLDDENADAFDAMACASLGRGEFEQAAEHALRAVALRPDFAEAHYHLGLALSQLNRPEAAAAAYQRALSIRPHLLAAYGRLIDLYEGPLLDQRRAGEARRRANELILQRRMHRKAKR